MRNRHTALAAAALTLGLAALVTACGPDDPDPAPKAAAPAPTTAAAAPTPTPTASAAPTTPAPTASAATSSPAVKPCHQDPARPEFVKLDSATTAGGVTKVNVTPVSCSYQVVNEEFVEYTPTGDATSYALAKNAVVQVIEMSGKKERTITPAELATYKLGSTPYFTVHRDGQGKVTAMKEIYHP